MLHASVCFSKRLTINHKEKTDDWGCFFFSLWGIDDVCASWWTQRDADAFEFMTQPQQQPNSNAFLFLADWHNSEPSSAFVLFQFSLNSNPIYVPLFDVWPHLFDKKIYTIYISCINWLHYHKQVTCLEWIIYHIIKTFDIQHFTLLCYEGNNIN